MQAGEESISYLQTMWNCASVGGLLPEQVWDTTPLLSRELLPGRPSGSAMPLLWAHAEFLKLLIARDQARPLELLKEVEKRYGDATLHHAAAWHWREEVPALRIENRIALLIEDRRSFTLHFGFDGWQMVQDREALAQPFGIWAVRFTADELSHHSELDFTRRYPSAWEGIDHHVLVDYAPADH